MLKFACCFLAFLLYALPAWAYFDPGFGGYLATSIFSMVVAGLAFVSAGLIYFFRNIVWRGLAAFWRRHRAVCSFLLLSGICIVSLIAGKIAKPRLEEWVIRQIVWNFFDPDLGKLLRQAVIPTAFIFSVLGVVIFGLRKTAGRRILLASLLCLLAITYAFLGMSFRTFLQGGVLSYNSGGKTVVTDPQRMSQGYTLLNGQLIDEQGMVIKHWSQELFGTLDENGDYYGAHQGSDGNSVWGRYTWDDKIVWEHPDFVHHEIYLSPHGTVFTFIKNTHVYNGHRVTFDVIIEYDKLGHELQRYSFWDHLKEYQPYHPAFVIDVDSPILRFFTQLLAQHMKHYDYFHLNSIVLLPPNPLESKNAAFRRGNWLISIFHGSMVFILDQDSKKIVWHAVNHEVPGELQGQHGVSMMPDGNILLFDNGIDRKASRILVIDPLTLKIKWEYSAKHFFSLVEGHVQYLPNGNFLITESLARRIREVTPDKKTVWEYYGTEMNFENTPADMYVSDIYRATRYPRDMIDYFLLATHEVPPSMEKTINPQHLLYN